MLKELLDAIARIFFGHRTVENSQDWYRAHQKANQSRAEVEKILAEAELDNNKKEK